MAQKKTILITEEAYLKGRDKNAPLTNIMRQHMLELIKRVNMLIAKSGLPYLGVSSGYRPPTVNAKVGGAKASAHMTCEAVDLIDPQGVFGQWCMDNIELLIKLDLYLESPSKTPTWVHLQTRPTKSGNRIFLP